MGVQWSGVSERGTLVFTFVVTSSITVSLSAMLLWHLYLAVSAQTTIEFYFNRWQKSQEAKRGNTEWRQPYDRGYFRNFCDFFNVAPTPLALLLWARPSLNGSTGDGVTWPGSAAPSFYGGGEHYV